jgi:membrane fusion protein, heavy metal efflux system
MEGRRIQVGQKLLMATLAVGLVALGAAGGLLFARSAGRPTRPSAITAASAPAAEAPSINQGKDESVAEIDVLLSPEAMSQAGIRTAPVSQIEPRASVQVPGVVAAHAYREVKVTPLVGGIVRKVHVELGTAVNEGALLATVFSAELAEAQTKYLSMRAMLAADHQRRERAEQLVEIGAASRQELEEAISVHVSHATEVESAKQRLLLLGLSKKRVEALREPRQVVSDVLVSAPIAGVVTGRAANLGQVVSMGQELFVVTDLSEVWAVGDLYEQDFSHVPVGAEATITTQAYPDLTLRGRVSYIDPRVEPQTRTAKVRVEVPNSDGRLRLGMYVTMTFRASSGPLALAVPRAAVQALGERYVVFIEAPGEEGRFIQRPATLGPLVGESYVVLKGLEPGDVVVTEGSFFLRAESLRNAPLH